jgi:hypothetical protein
MIIWTGQGYLVVVLVFLLSLGTEWGVESAFDDDTYYQLHAWPLALALFTSGAISWLLGNYFNSEKERVVIDKGTGQEMVIGGPNHTLFFIKMHYWGPILMLIAASLFFFRPF